MGAGIAAHYEAAGWRMYAASIHSLAARERDWHDSLEMCSPHWLGDFSPASSATSSLCRPTPVFRNTAFIWVLTV